MNVYKYLFLKKIIIINSKMINNSNNAKLTMVIMIIIKAKINNKTNTQIVSLFS